ncbi:solute carrier family 23 protein [Microbacterium sp.]|uniref:solute carrier family 23 protein n=1 Tax=Microbacterium sp. TaxID=51671 RepID=UPI003C75FCB2
MSAPTAAPARPVRKHPVDQVPPVPKLLTYGFQHVAAFYAGAVIVPLIIGGALGVTPEDMVKLIQADLLTCGIASLLQSIGIRIGKYRIGVQLPLLQGVAFAGVAPLITIGFNHGGGSPALPWIFGAVIVSGIVFFLVAPLIARAVRFFPPVVTGTVLTIIGVTLLPVAANHAIGGQLGLPGFDWSYSVMGASQGGHGDPTSGINMIFAIGTIIVILLLQRFFTGFLSTISVLVGLIVGFVAWYAILPSVPGSGVTFDWSAVSGAEAFWIASPFHYGPPQFAVGDIIAVLLVMMITAVETVGSLYATGDIVGKRISRQDISDALKADGISTALGGTMGSFPYTCFAENIGLVRVTGVKSRWIVAVAGGFMMILGLFPQVAAVVGMIPEPVLGGSALVLFAAVAITGIQTLSTVNFNDHRNLAVAGTGLAVGVYVMAFPGVTQAVPEWLQWYFSGGIAAGAFTTILLNIVFFHLVRRGPNVTTDAAGDVVTLDRVNGLSEDEFAALFHGVVQDNTWAIERAYAERPFASAAALADAFQDALLAGTDAEVHELLESFPDLGSAEADGSVVRESSGALADVDDDQRADLGELSAEYRAKFGFPLIISVKDVERYDQVVGIGWSRMDNSVRAERQAALVEVSKIVRHRFDDLIADANPITSARFGRFADLGTD